MEWQTRDRRQGRQDCSGSIAATANLDLPMVGGAGATPLVRAHRWCIIRSDRHPVLPPGADMQRKLRILIAKPGLDGHDRGAKVIARALRDAGMEVIYTGLRQTPEMIAEAALQEDVDAIGLSILSGAHMALVPRIFELLRAQDQGHVRLLLGGIIPDEDVPALREMGVAAVFGPGTPTKDVIGAFVSSAGEGLARG